MTLNLSAVICDVRGLFRAGLSLIAALVCAPLPAFATSDDAIVVALDGDFSGFLRDMSESARIGVATAFADVNAAGGVAGRPLRLASFDHRGNPRRAKDNFIDALAEDNAVAMIAAGYTTGAVAALEPARDARVPVISAFPSSSSFIRNGLTDSPAFRVSAHDDLVAVTLVDAAVARGAKRIALLVENSPWGVSNTVAIRKALEAAGSDARIVEAWFALGGADFERALALGLGAEADVVIVFGKAPQGVALIEAVAQAPSEGRPAILAHWGVTPDGSFGRAAAAHPSIDVAVIQTFVRGAEPFPERAEAAFASACRHFGACGTADIPQPMVFAHGYDAGRLVALGLAQVADGAAPDLLAALMDLPRYEGLLRDYDPAFTADRREALEAGQHLLATYGPDGLPRLRAAPVAPR